MFVVIVFQNLFQMSSQGVKTVNLDVFIENVGQKHIVNVI